MGKNKYMIQIDGLRTVAVGLVIFCHYASMTQLSYFNHFLGATGVTLFFVLSGFLITSILISSKVEQETNSLSNWFILKQFYIRRFLRIFPLYYLAIFLGLVFNIEGCRDQIVALVTYTANWVLDKEGNLGYYSHMWSLAVEEQYYMFFPIIFIFLKHKYLNQLFITMITLAIISRIMIVGIGHIYDRGDEIKWAAYKLTPTCLDTFGIGSLFAFAKFYYEEKTRKILQTPYLWIIATICILLSLSLWLYDTNYSFVTIINAIFNRIFLSIACLYVIGLACFSEFKGMAGRFLENKFVLYFGKISYGLYVYHYIILYFFDGYKPTHSSTLNLLIMRPICLVITIGLASLSWELFEKPLNNLKKYFSYSPHPDKMQVL